MANLRDVIPLVLAFTMAIGGAAADDIIPKPDPKGHWRVVHVDDERSTTKCIGNPITPLCAVETWMGCYVRRIRTLCGIALDDESRLPLFDYKIRHYSLTRYHLVKADILTKKTMPKPSYAVHPEDWRPGDLRIMVRSENCLLADSDEICPSMAPDYHGYILRQSDGRWWIVGMIPPPRR